MQARRETAAVSNYRDDLIGQRETARAYTASALGNGTPRGGRQALTTRAALLRPRAARREPAMAAALGLLRVDPDRGNHEEHPGNAKTTPRPHCRPRHAALGA
jgi:hypothetical protein